MAKIHFNTAFENMSEKDINTWIVFNRKRLVGSAIFTCNDSFTSKGEVDDTSYETLKMTFGHVIRSLVSCGVDPYEKTNEGKSFVDLAISENFYKLMHENYDGYIEAKEIKTEEQAI